MFLLKRQRSAMRSTRAPSKPIRANSSVACFSIFSRTRAGSLLRGATLNLHADMQRWGYARGFAMPDRRGQPTIDGGYEGRLGDRLDRPAILRHLPDPAR